MVDADDAEAGALVQSEARDVLGKDPRHELPEAARRVLAAERVERDTPGPRAACGALHVDRMFRDARVRRAAAVGPGGRPRDDGAVALGHDGWEPVALVG